MQHPFQSAAVAQVFEHYPANARHQLLALRDLIFKTSFNTAGVGQIEETLKWGKPAYLTPDSKSGSTIRIAWKKSAPSLYSMYCNCNTSLVDTFRTLFPSEFKLQGNRAIVLEVSEVVPKDASAFCIAAALTYHLRPSRQPAGDMAKAQPWAPHLIAPERPPGTTARSRRVRHR